MPTMPGCPLILAKITLEEYSSLSDKVSLLEFQRSRTILQCHQQMRDTHRNLNHSNLMQPHATLPYQAHPYSVSVTLSDGIVIRLFDSSRTGGTDKLNLLDIPSEHSTMF
ncbi:hypothetical protein Tco_0304343 [Tanacetum coccineum]